MTRQIRDRNYQRTQGMTHAERLAFYQQHAAEMRARANSLPQSRARTERVSG